MKKLFCFTLLFITLHCYSASIEETVAGVVDSTTQAVKEGVAFADTSSTFKMMYSDVKEAVMGLAGALKVGAEHVYEVLVRQQIVYSCVYLLVFLIGIFFVYKCHTEWEKIKCDEYDDIEEVRPVVFTFVYGVVGALCFIVGIFNINGIVTGFVNPEYGAIMDILKFVK